MRGWELKQEAKRRQEKASKKRTKQAELEKNEISVPT